MDNGLIFPYPRRSAQDEPSGANYPNLPATFGLMVREHRILWGSSLAMG